MRARAVPERVSFPEAEEAILRWWEDNDTFFESVRRSEGKKPYVFYDGPPFATGLPHYGHRLAGTIKVRSSARGRRAVSFEATLLFALVLSPLSSLRCCTPCCLVRARTLANVFWRNPAIRGPRTMGCVDRPALNLAPRGSPQMWSSLGPCVLGS